MNPTEPYDDKVRMLKLIDELQPDHIRLLRAIDMDPNPNPGGGSGSPGETLRRRLTGDIHQRIGELLTDLQTMGIATLTNLNTMMTSGGAENLRHSITAVGRRLLRYMAEPGPI